MEHLPICTGCGHPLNRVDHFGIEHTIMAQGVYRDVGIHDGDAEGGQFGISAETDLRCARCGKSLETEAKAYYYKHWDRVLEITGGRGVEL